MIYIRKFTLRPPEVKNDKISYGLLFTGWCIVFFYHIPFIKNIINYEGSKFVKSASKLMRVWQEECKKSLKKKKRVSGLSVASRND